MKHILDILDEIVESIRDANTITNIVDNSNNTYTVYTSDVKGLTINSYVKFANTTSFTKDFYLITDVSTNNFTISETSGLTINLFGSWTALTPYFLFEKWDGAANEVSLNHFISNYSKQNYPLILVLLDISENREQLGGSIYSELSLNIFIINKTEVDVTAKYRLENNFKTVLIPIYEKLINALKNSYYTIIDNNLLQHNYTERYYQPNQLNDFVDAIELNLNLKIKNIPICLT